MPDGSRHLESSYYTFLFGDDSTAKPRIRRDNAVGGDIAATNVFGECPANGIDNPQAVYFNLLADGDQNITVLLRFVAVEIPRNDPQHVIAGRQF